LPIVSSDGSVSRWLELFKDGDRTPVQPLWERYFRRLVGLARLHLQSMPRTAADEEDVALAAFASFCQGIERGRFPQLNDRDDLWRLLVVLTVRKAGRLRRFEGQLKRGGDTSPALAEELETIISREPSPAFAAEVGDACRDLLARLDDERLGALALRKMEGYTNGEIAAQLGCSPRTVERKLELIRELWQAEDTT
jgi:DNA-directed RNA polymerase specialized sigma24 family protein